MAIERSLTEKIGPVGGRLHTARSRNDQVTLDLRLFVRAEIGAILKLITAFQKALAATARRHAKVVMPGYTHCSARSRSFRAPSPRLPREARARLRALRRLPPARRRHALGAGALAGTTSPSTPSRWHASCAHTRIHHSLDAVSERDFIVELLAASAILATHLSRLAEEIILWSSSEFGFISLPDEFATGSSIMRRRRTRTSPSGARQDRRVYGNLVAILTILKGLPLAYNRDLQEDKVPLFDTVDTVKGCLAILTALIPRLAVHADRMRAPPSTGFSSPPTSPTTWSPRASRSARRITSSGSRSDAVSRAAAASRISLRRNGASSRRRSVRSPRVASIDAALARRTAGGAPRRRTWHTACAGCDDFAPLGSAPRPSSSEGAWASQAGVNPACSDLTCAGCLYDELATRSRGALSLLVVGVVGCGRKTEVKPPQLVRRTW